MQRYSVFLTPSDEDFPYLDHIIRELCGKYGGHPFEPHVTLYSGDLHDLEGLKQVVTAAVAGVGPFILKSRGVDCRDEYFKSLFIRFEDDPVPAGIHDRIRDGLASDSGYVLSPHLSLLYSDIPLCRKRDLAGRLVLERPGVRFDRVKIVSPGNLGEGWRDTSSWLTLFRVGLRLGPGRNA